MSSRKLRRYDVRFQIWKAYRLEIEAESVAQAIGKARAVCHADLSQAEAIAGDLTHWEAIPLPATAKRVIPRPKSQRYVVQFHDWTAYRMEIEAESPEDALDQAQDMSMGRVPEQAESFDGGLDEWEAFPLPRSKAGAP